jgi:RNA methyltransferase, TrmH family
VSGEAASGHVRTQARGAEHAPCDRSCLCQDSPVTLVSSQAELIDRFRRSRRDPELAIVEGFHALKHALRFGAELLAVLCVDAGELERLAGTLAPDLIERLRLIATPVGAQALSEVGPRAPRTGVVALARRPAPDERTLLTQLRPAPIVLLEEPRDLNNVGACVRVAAAADAAGVIVTGRHDPWHADAIRGSAGLHFALPVLWWRQMRPRGDRPLVALDPHGEPLVPGELPARTVLAFGSERAGLSDTLLAAADATRRIPMRPGVSSLNLATSVAATLFALRLCN